jgi:hypothetical protein
MGVCCFPKSWDAGKGWILTMLESVKLKHTSMARPKAFLRPLSGAILLEVILAMALFVGAATVILLGVNASVVAVQRMRLETHAMNHATSAMAAMQMQLRSIEAVTDEKLEPPFEDWLLSIEIEPMESDLVVESLNRVEVIIRHETELTVVRLTQVLRMTDAMTDEQREALSPQDGSLQGTGTGTGAGNGLGSGSGTGSIQSF